MPENLCRLYFIHNQAYLSHEFHLATSVPESQKLFALFSNVMFFSIRAPYMAKVLLCLSAVIGAVGGGLFVVDAHSVSFVLL